MRPFSTAARLSPDGTAIAKSQHNPEAFTEVFDRHFAFVHRYVARRIGRDRADDLASQTFTVAFAHRGRYRDDLGTARPWLLGIATNLMRAEYRFALAGGVAVAGLAVAAAVLGLQGGGLTPSPALAATMDRLGRIAEAQDWSGLPGPGQYLYTRSEGAFASYSGGVDVDHRQIWFPSSGRLLLSDAAVNRTVKVASIGGRTGTGFPTTVSGWKSLSTDPATLLQQIHRLDGGPNSAAEEFVNVNDALRENPIPPAIRAALYRAVALIPGVTLVGQQTDPLGQSGLGVLYQAPSQPTDPETPTTKLIFDQKTGRMLAEENYNQAGKLTGWTSYLQQEVVDSAPSAGSIAPATDFPPFQTTNLAAPTVWTTSTTTSAISPTPAQSTTTP